MNEVGTRRESLGQFRSRLLDQLGRRRVNYYEDLPLRERLEGFRPAKRLTAAGNRRSDSCSNKSPCPDTPAFCCVKSQKREIVLAVTVGVADRRAWLTKTGALPLACHHPAPACPPALGAFYRAAGAKSCG
jgi:hypothetical protein